MKSYESKQKLAFIQHNTNRSSPAKYSILQMACENNTDIVLIQEPSVVKDRRDGNFFCISYLSFHLITLVPPQTTNTITIRPWTLTYIRKNIDLEFTLCYNLCNDPDMQIIELVDKIQRFFIINIYNEKKRLDTSSNTHPSQTTSPATQTQGLYTIDWLLLLLKLKTLTILAGDFNLHHERWNAAANPSKTYKV